MDIIGRLSPLPYLRKRETGPSESALFLFEKENKELKQALEELLAVAETGNSASIALKARETRKKFPHLKSRNQLREERRARVSASDLP